nr:putative late blight resistance protein homolog R1B-16 isoform X1 [Ipomoea batatas]GMD36319.1 putative late blight resistance protein homolog R1B-16 isoform X1 [Ipomoea batatas]
MCFQNENSNGFCNLVHLRQLEKLSIKEWPIKLPDSSILWETSFLPNLKKLKFIFTTFPWSDIRLIGMLPNLEVLKLIDACQGKEWEPCEGRFRQLKRLVIESWCLENWNAADDHFPVLQHLELSGCSLLQEIPIEFANITALTLIQLNRCLDSVLASAKSIQDEKQIYGNEAFLVRSRNILSKSKISRELKDVIDEGEELGAEADSSTGRLRLRRSPLSVASAGRLHRSPPPVTSASGSAVRYAD